MQDVLRNLPIVFHGFILDRQAGCLLRVAAGGVHEPVPLGSRALDVLATLAARSGEVVPKSEIMDAVWPGLAVEENNLTVQISALRRILDQGRNGASLIQTIPARGYRLAVQASVLDNSEPRSAVPVTESAAGAPGRSPALRPSLVVLPFVNAGDDPGLGDIAEGITNELTTALARMRWFHVLGRGTTSGYVGRPLDLKRIGQELDARYVLDGNVRQADGQLRITCQLIETESGRHVWAHRIDCPAGNAFVLQDTVTCAVAGNLATVIERAEVERAHGRPAANPGAFELYLRALRLRARATREDIDEALALLRRAVDIDADFGPAKGDALICCVHRHEHGWASAGEREEAIRLARAAFIAHGDDPLTLTCVSQALSIIAHDHDGALEAALRAVALDPLCIWARNAAGWARLRTCDPAAAIEHFEFRLCLSPHDTDVGWTYVGLGIAHLALDAPDRALPLATQGLRHLPRSPLAHRTVITILSELGSHEQAAAAARHFRETMPESVVVPDYQSLYRDKALAERLIRGLRAAGLPG